jgi:hypothetical protein
MAEIVAVPVLLLVGAYVCWSLRWRNRLTPFVNDRYLIAGTVAFVGLALEAVAVILGVLFFWPDQGAHKMIAGLPLWLLIVALLWGGLGFWITKGLAYERWLGWGREHGGGRKSP